MLPIIQFENVRKEYRLGGPTLSLRQTLVQFKDRIIQNKSQDNRTLIALNGVSFDIHRGESVGFIGPNGSGKTTTLKLISQITRCDQGRVRVNGTVSALIELGAGFHPELTGRDNIFFNAAILGMRQKDIQRRFDAIVDFSGLERFLDTPVKRYSSGMYCRLGFAVAAFVNPDILLVDEVLAVGDQAFQSKCLKRMSELREEGTTIIFVTHNLGYLQRLCRRVLFLYQGDVIRDGSVNEVIQAYRDHISYTTGNADTLSCMLTESPGTTGQLIPGRSAFSDASIKDVYFTNGFREKVDRICTGEEINVHVQYEISAAVDPAIMEIWFYGIDGTEYASFASSWDSTKPGYLEGAGEVQLHIDRLCLMPGTYFVNVAISDQDGLKKYDIHWDCHKLSVLSGPISHGIIFQPHQWLFYT